MGIDRTIKRLLDNAETNIGNQVSYPSNPLAGIVISPDRNPQRILDLTAASNTGQIITVGMSAFSNPPNTTNAFAGPFTGVVEYGNGGISTRVEFDVPVNQIAPGDTPSNAKDGNVLITVPGGTLRVYGRDDSNLVTPSFQFTPAPAVQFGMPASLGGIGGGTDNIPRGFGPWSAGPDATIGGAIKAHATYATRADGQGSRVTKTVWVYNTDTGNGSLINEGAGTPALYFVPPMAKTVQVFRNAFATNTPACAVKLDVRDQTGIMERFAIAAGVVSPIFELPGGVVMIGVETTTANINTFALVFEIGI